MSADVALDVASDSHASVEDLPPLPSPRREARGDPSPPAANGTESNTEPSPARPPNVQTKRTNPLVDLIDTEKGYVELLTAIIRKIASAWSRTNFPPPALDAMFRAVEAVYKANRQLLAKLNEIGPNPSSPKALGDLLMRWIEDLEGPYTRYASAYATGFDVWEPVSSNARLPTVLADLTAVNPPRQPPPMSPDPGGSSMSNNAPSVWTLDALFALPYARLRYYKKLYARLLKSTQPGRSDFKLLTNATEKLATLISKVEDRQSVHAGDEDAPEPAAAAVQAAPPETGKELCSVKDEERRSRDQSVALPQSLEPPVQDAQPRPDSEQARSSVRSSGATGSQSSRSDADRLSRDTASTSVGNFPSSQSIPSAALEELERRLAPERTLDIFTMKPKLVRLQMNPPGLPFARSLRCSADVTIVFTPRSTGEEFVDPLGHVFVLSDLFLVCTRMSAEEQVGREGHDMWLSYPPLAGKHLRLEEVPGEENSFRVVIMKKETLTLILETRLARDTLMAHFNDCIGLAMSMSGGIRAQPPPPMSNGPPPKFGQDIPIVAQHGPPSWNNGPLPPGMSPSGSRGPSPLPPVANGSDGPMDLRHASNGVDFASGPPPPIGAGPMQRATPPPQGGAAPYIPPPRGASRGAYAGNPNGPLPPGPGYSNPMAPPPIMLPDQFPGPPPPRLQDPMNPAQLSPFNSSPTMSSAGPAGPDRLRKSPSARSVGSGPPHLMDDGRRPSLPGGYPVPGPPPGPPYPYPPGNFPPQQYPYPPGPGQPMPMGRGYPPRSASAGANTYGQRSASYRDVSPPMSPEAPTGPITSVLSAQMKCKVFLQQQHQQWKNLGSARLKLYLQQPINQKQLVVEAETKEKTVLISTIVLTDGVERVGKTGVAIELSDNGLRTGIVYMIQLRNENSASGLFNSLLAGSDRAR